MKDIRQDLLDSYLYIQHNLNDKLAELSEGKAPKIDTARCISAGGSAGGSSCLFLAMEIRDYNAKQDAAGKVNNLRGILPAYPMCNPDDGYKNTPRSELEQRAKQDCPDDWLVIQDVFKGPTICDFKTK
jgi:acetyl esterase/lipase